MKSQAVLRKSVIAVVAGVLTLGIAGAVVANQSAALAEDDTAQSYSDWKQMYPDQYGSFATHAYSDGMDLSHFALRGNEEAYFDPAYPKTGYCMSCKSSSLNAMYELYGDAMFAMTEDDAHFEQQVDGAYWDCLTCHADSETLELNPSLIVFQKLGGEEFATSPTETLLCGQCHNASGAFTSIMSEGNGLDEVDPYRYGHDADGMYKAYIEDMGSLDEATGAVLAAPGYSELEMYTDSIHASLGLTCVDCHMTQTMNENLEGFTNHNASQSPFENPEVLQTCLTCHAAQGIEDVDGMLDFYGEVEAQLHEKMDAASAARDELAAALTAATAEGVEGDAIDRARECYSQAYFFTYYASSYIHGGDYRVAHNNQYMTELAGRIQQLCDEGLELLA